jgi:hypothetical protein
MTPQGGFTTLFHLAILLGKMPREKLLSILVITTISFVTFRIGAKSIHEAYRNSPIQELVSEIQGCQEVVRPESRSMVVLRLDDVQAYAWRNISIEMMRDAIAKNMKVSAVTIPLQLNTDKTLTSFLKTNQCNIELVLHGYDNTGDPPEFAFLSQEQANQKIEMGLTELSQVSSQKVNFFVPPENTYSPGTSLAIKAKQMHISAEGGAYYDYNATTYDFSHNKLHDKEHVVTECESRLVTDNICILMLHPQDFADEAGHKDIEKYSTYLGILDYLAQKNYRVVTFSELPQSPSRL